MIILARLFFILLVIVIAGGVGYFVWHKWIHPFIFKEEMSNKLEDAGEDFLESEVDKKADELRKGGPDASE